MIERIRTHDPKLAAAAALVVYVALALLVGAPPWAPGAVVGGLLSALSAIVGAVIGAIMALLNSIVAALLARLAIVALVVSVAIAAAAELLDVDERTELAAETTAIGGLAFAAAVAVAPAFWGVLT